MRPFDLKKIFLSIKEHKKDSILIFLIVFILTIFTTIFYVFYLSSEQMSKSISDNVRVEINVKNINLSFTDKDYINDVLEKYDFSFNLYKTYYKDIDSIIENLANYQGIESYGNITYISLKNENVSKYSLICANANKRLFNLDKFVITDGRYFDDNELEGAYNYILAKNGLNISDELGNSSNINVGDKITLINDLNEEYIFEVIGLFDKENNGNLMDKTNYYDSTVNFILPLNDLLNITSPGDSLISSDPIIKVAGVNNSKYIQNYLESAFNSLNIREKFSSDLVSVEIDDSMARKLEKPIKTIQILFQVISIIMIIIMFILLCCFLLTIINNRIHDIGIFISIGQSKFKTIFIFLIEIFIISSLAFILSIPLSYKVSVYISNQMVEANLKRQRRIATISKSEEQLDVFEATKNAYENYVIEVSNKDYLFIYIYTNIIIIVSSFAALISIIKTRPKELLIK